MLYIYDIHYANGMTGSVAALHLDDAIEIGHVVAPVMKTEVHAVTRIPYEEMNGVWAHIETGEQAYDA